MHTLFAKVLTKKDLSKAGDLFSLDDEEIEASDSLYDEPFSFPSAISSSEENDDFRGTNSLFLLFESLTSFSGVTQKSSKMPSMCCLKSEEVVVAGVIGVASIDDLEEVDDISSTSSY